MKFTPAGPQSCGGRSPIVDPGADRRTWTATRWWLVWLVCFASPSGLALAAEATADQASAGMAASAAGIAFFETKVRPLLAEHCYECHGAEAQEAGLRLDTWQGMAAGGDSGPAVVAGQPGSNLLLLAASYLDPGLQMPPDGPLSEREVADLEHWVELGVPHPDAADSAVAARPRGADAGDLWSLKPMQPAEPPQVEDAGQPSNPIDAFILARLESAGLTPNRPADRRTLIRRATFDLTGLPPTPAEVERFLADDAPDAYVRLVDRLLASPAYGERWGRHWLDVARYADSNGLDENIAHGNAWRYRDWVVGAWNADLPYAEFVTQQVAGDLAASEDPETRRGRLIATGYLVLGPKVLAEADKTKMEMDIIDEQLDTLGRSFLGLTFGCARCHDHKFDPILTEDYYALAGVFKSTLTMDSFKTIARWHEHEIATAEQLAAQEAHHRRLAEQRQTLEQSLALASDALRTQLGAAAAFPEDPEPHYPEETRQQLAALRKTISDLEAAAPEVDSAMGVAEGEATDLAVHIRGSHLSLGATVPRRFPSWLPTSQEYLIPANQSGRLQLAHWITDRENPLTWRVISNRLWRWHFGRGLVASVDNFGHLGAEPTHPQLLDWMARELAGNGGSLKRMQRLIMLSSTYQRSSQDNSLAAQTDPENELLWRAPLRRLEAESLRDGLLQVSGRLDRRMGGTLLHVENRGFLFDHTSKDDTSYDHPVRSLYLPVIRNNLYDGFQLFDYADAGVINGDRAATTVPTQALFLMNSPLLQQAAEGLARRILDPGHAAADPTTSLYQLALGREPTESERRDVQDSLGRLLPLLAMPAPPYAQSAAEVPPKAEAPDSAEVRAWTVICQAVLASNEFLYLP